jgi:hypothetical protein
LPRCGEIPCGGGAWSSSRRMKSRSLVIITTCGLRVDPVRQERRQLGIAPEGHASGTGWSNSGTVSARVCRRSGGSWWMMGLA